MTLVSLACYDPDFDFAEVSSSGKFEIRIYSAYRS